MIFTVVLVLLMILWTWGLTPLWVNITATCLFTLRYLIRFGTICLNATAKQINKNNEQGE